MSTIVQSYDASNNAVYPVTHLRAVRDSSGTTLESMMQDVREITVGYYECSTPGSTATKTITTDSSVSLSTKILCKVKFVEKNTANNTTMNINGTGAKALYYNGVRAAANNSWYPNEVVDLYYDGTNYQAKSCADTLEYDVSLHQTHEITEITKTTRTLVFNGNVVSSWESETSISDSSVEGYTRSETNTGQDVDSTTVDGPNATYDSSANRTNVVYVTTHTYTHVVNNYTFKEAVNAVPMSYRHGGLKLRFISNSGSDNKYVQYRLMTTAWSNIIDDWQGVDNEPTAGSNNLVKSGGVAEKLSELDRELNGKRETGIVNGYVSNNNWIGLLSYNITRFIKVVSGDIVHIVKNDERESYYFICESTDTSISPTLSKSAVRGTDETFTVLSSGYLMFIDVLYKGTNEEQNWLPSVLTINGQDCLNAVYTDKLSDKISKNANDIAKNANEIAKNANDIAKNANEIELVNDSVDDIQSVVVVPPKNIITHVDFESKTDGKYWNLVDEVAGMVSTIEYFARNELVDVNANDVIIWKVPKSVGNVISSGCAGFYDNDLHGVFNGQARLNFSPLMLVESTDEYDVFEYSIPSGCTKVGFFYKVEQWDISILSNKPIKWSEDLDNHILSLVGEETFTSDSDKYYLKGKAPKTFSKKICILAAGQSNIDGRVPYSQMPTEISTAQPIANCHYVSNSIDGSFSSLNITGNWAFDLITYYNLATRANKEIYVIKKSMGGTSIDALGDSQYHWTADYEELDSISKSLLYDFEMSIRNHILSSGDDFDIRAMLWHQGEGDRCALGTGSADRYYVNLRNMIAYIRGVVGNERLPFITGTISHRSAQYDAVIEAAQMKLAEEDPYFYLIDMSGAYLLDSYHFNAESSIYFGQKAYDALIDAGVITGSKINPTKPW